MEESRYIVYTNRSKSNECYIPLGKKYGTGYFFKRAEIIAYILKELRTTKKYSQAEVAEALGIAQNQYARYETGKTMPAIETIIRLASIYRVSIDYICGINIENHNFNIEEEIYYNEEKEIWEETLGCQEDGTILPFKFEQQDIFKRQIYITELKLIYAKLKATLEQKAQEKLIQEAKKQNI